MLLIGAPNIFSQGLLSSDLKLLRSTEIIKISSFYIAEIKPIAISHDLPTWILTAENKGNLQKIQSVLSDF